MGFDRQEILKSVLENLASGAAERFGEESSRIQQEHYSQGMTRHSGTFRLVAQALRDELDRRVSRVPSEVARILEGVQIADFDEVTKFVLNEYTKLKDQLVELGEQQLRALSIRGFPSSSDDFDLLTKGLDDRVIPEIELAIAKLQKSQAPQSKEVVLLIHGIRDFAEWQEMVSSVLAEIPATEIYPLKYGRFDAFRFWFPIWTRKAPVTNVLWRIHAARDSVPPPQLSVIAHSFGTHAIGKILKENPHIRLHRLILCGAILPRNFRWDQIRNRVETDIINDCGIRDIWPVLAQSTTSGYGPSGRFGFGTPGVRDRYHDFAHGGFFQEKFVRDFWLPWFQKGEFVKSNYDVMIKIRARAKCSGRPPRAIMKASLNGVPASKASASTPLHSTPRHRPGSRTAY